MPFPECTLSVCGSLCSLKCAIIFEQTICSSKRNLSVITDQRPIYFFVEGSYVTSDHSLGISSMSIDCQKR